MNRRKISTQTARTATKPQGHTATASQQQQQKKQLTINSAVLRTLLIYVSAVPRPRARWRLVHAS